MGLIFPSTCMFMSLFSLSACQMDSTWLTPPSLFPATWEAELHEDDRNAGPHSPYLRLPVFRHAAAPLVDKEEFSPAARGTVPEPLPERVRRILLPVPTPVPGPLGNRSSTGARGRRHGVRVACGAREMRVKVPRVFVGSVEARYEVKLGTCSASRSTRHHQIFSSELNTCGTERQIIHNRVVYTNSLHYRPLETPVGTLRSLSGFSVPIQCHFNRFHYSYKIGFVPHVETQRLYKSMRTTGSATLTPCDEQWNNLPSSEGYTIGQPMYFQAEVASVGEGERLFIHACHVTANSSRLSTPRITIIHNYGCLIDSRNSSRSRFIKSSKRNVVRFSIGAFVFHGKVTKHLYMHCEMSVASENSTAISKFCTYNQKKSRWEELYSSNKVCSCCDSTCLSGAPTVMNRSITSTPWSMMEEKEEEEVEYIGGDGHMITSEKMKRPTETRRIFEEVFGLD